MNPQRFRLVFRVFWAIVSLGLAGTAHAQGELNKPYHLRIVVHVTPNRLLTDVFRKQIERELHDGLQAGLGDMGRVEVTHRHERLQEVLSQGLQALNGWKERSDVKTHFVLIDFSGVHYEIQSRQYDGTIGRASPVVRRDRTRDRDFVAKAAALLIKQDFGLLGTVVTAPEGAQQLAKVELRGGGLGNMARWVQKGEVFSLAPPGGGSSAALDWALLQVEQPPEEDARDGLCTCRFFHRFQVRDITGYRCIKLGTVRTPLRLRWVQENPRGKPLDASTSLTVYIRRHGFEGEDTTKLQRQTGKNGVLDTTQEGDKGVFTHVAFVSVAGGMAKPYPQVPVALVDDQPIFIEVNATQDTKSLFTVRRTAWQSDVLDSQRVQAALFQELADLSAKADQREEVIKRAERGLKRSQTDRADLMREKTALLKEAKSLRLTPPDTTREDEVLKEMVKGEEELNQFIGKQKDIEKSESDPQLKKWRREVQRAKLLEKDLEIGKAIDIYKQIQEEGFNDAEVEKHLKQLQDQWKTMDADHEEARDFIYRVWPVLDTAGLEENLPKARKAFDKCNAAHDTFTIRKMLKGTQVHAERLAKELGELRPDLRIDDERRAEPLKKISDAVVKLGKDIQAYLSRPQPAPKS
jgi:hypothetical protein